MSDREIMEAKGLGNTKKYPTSTSRFNVKSINNPDLIEGWKYKDTKFKSSKDYMPDQKWHRYVSFIKSGIRILGYGLIPFNLVVATIVLIFSEIVGVIEELV